MASYDLRTSISRNPMFFFFFELVIQLLNLTKGLRSRLSSTRSHRQLQMLLKLVNSVSGRVSVVSRIYSSTRHSSGTTPSPVYSQYIYINININKYICTLLTHMMDINIPNHAYE